MRGASVRRIAPLADAFADATRDGTPAALVVRRDTDLLADLSTGRDARGRLFSSTTPILLYSAVKPFTALTVLLAVARGELGLDDPVAETWPTFGVGGKDAVTVRQALAHGAGVPGWRERMALSDLADVPTAAEALAGQLPWWPPGEPAEHALSYGHLLDGILRHGTGEGVPAWWPRVQAATGVCIHLFPADARRGVAPLEDPDRRFLRSWREATGPMARLLGNPGDLLDAGVVNGPAISRLMAPAVTGYGSARDLADLWAWWNGPAAGRVLGEGLRAASVTPQVEGHDHVLERWVSWGLGPQIDATSLGMGGVGGSFGIYHRPRELAVALTTPRLGRTDRFDALDDALAALD